jgi:tetratricopeptide (TPR) repeat protein
LWLLAPSQSVSASADHLSGQVRTPARAALPPDASRTSPSPFPASADMTGLAGEPAIGVLIAKGWAAIHRGHTLENLTEAMAAFKEAHKRDGNQLGAMVGIAAASINLVGNFLTAEPAPYLDQAESFLQRALRKKPDDAITYHYSGRLHLARGQYEAALRAYIRARELNPSFPYTHAQIGHILVRSGRASEGMAQIRYAMQLSPSSPAIGYWYLYAGEAELELGQTGAALEWLQKALAVLPSRNPHVHQVLAATYALRGDHANAVKHAGEFRRNVPEARIADLGKQFPVRLQEGLSLALALSNPDKRP